MNRLPVTPDNQVDSTIHAAAFAALGFRVAVHGKERVQTGETQMTFCVSETSPTREGLSMCRLKHLMNSGELAKVDPTHPLLDAVRCLRNRESLLKWMKGGTEQWMRQEANCERWRFADGQPLQDDDILHVETPPREVIQVSQISIAAGLICCGIKLLRWDGNEGSRLFSFAPQSFLLRQSPPFLNTRSILEAFGDPQWRDSNPDHPLVLSWKACDAYVQILKLIRKPQAIFMEDTLTNSGRTVELPPNPTNEQLDGALKHFKR